MLAWQVQQLQILTGAEHFPHAQVADDEPHDGGLVHAGADAVGQGQLLRQLVEHLRLLPTPGSRRIPRLLLPPIRAHPAGERRRVSQIPATNGFDTHDKGRQGIKIKKSRTLCVLRADAGLYFERFSFKKCFYLFQTRSK